MAVFLHSILQSALLHLRKKYLKLLCSLIGISKSGTSFLSLILSSMVSLCTPTQRVSSIRETIASIDQKDMSSATEQAAASGIDAELLMKVLSNPEMVKVLQMLSKTVG